MRVMYGVQAVYGVHCVPLQMGFLLVRVARASAGDSVFFFFVVVVYERERERRNCEGAADRRRNSCIAKPFL